MKIHIPKNELLWVTYVDNTGKEIYIVTSNKDRSSYFLYSILETGKLEKIKKALSPDEFDSIINK